jgi:mannose-1-phosphate guanylyltransferase
VQALILAGGEGTRLRPLTYTVPKPVLPLANRPFASYMIDWLAQHGFRDVVMSCGFLADEVRSVLGEVAHADGVELSYVEEPEPMGTAGAVKFCEDVLEARFAVLNGDVLTDLDISSLWRTHEERGARASLALVAVEDPSAYGLVELANGGAVAEFREKPAPGTVDRGLINAGAYVMERDVLDGVPAGRAVSFEREVFPALVGNGLYAQELDGYWLDIGTPERYLQGTRDILTGAVHTAVGPLEPPVLVAAGARVADGAELANCTVVGEDCAVEPDCALDGAVLLSGVTVARGAVVRDSIVGAGARIGTGAQVEGQSVVGEGATVPDGARINGERIEA